MIGHPTNGAGGPEPGPGPGPELAGVGFAAIWRVRAGLRPGIETRSLARSWGIPAAHWPHLTPAERSFEIGRRAGEASMYAAQLAGDGARWVTVSFDRLSED